MPHPALKVEHWPACCRLAGNNNLKLQNPFAATDAGHARTHCLQDGAAIERADKGLDLALVTSELYGVDLVGNINDAAAEDIGHALHLVSFLAHSPDLDQHQFALDVRAFGQVHHLDHIDQAIQMLGDLLDHLIRTVGHDGHAR